MSKKYGNSEPTQKAPSKPQPERVSTVPSDAHKHDPNFGHKIKK